MKLKYTITLILAILLSTSCDFNINDSPGTKLSSSIKEAVSHGTYLCTYKDDSTTIQGINLETIFAERRYSREKGIFLKKKIDCCKAQLIIVSSNKAFSTQSSGYDVDWRIDGFGSPSPGASIIYKDYNTIVMPDLITFKVISIKGADSGKTIGIVKLYKVKGGGTSK